MDLEGGLGSRSDSRIYPGLDLLSSLPLGAATAPICFSAFTVPRARIVGKEAAEPLRWSETQEQNVNYTILLLLSDRSRALSLNTKS